MTTREQWIAMKDPNRREHFVYCAYDARGVLLYIGCTMQPDKRREGHKGQRAEWVNFVSYFRAHGPYNYETARRMERSAIREHQPPFNGDTTTYRAASKKQDELLSQLTRRYVAEGMSFNEASMRALGDVDRKSPRRHHYRQLVSA